MTGLVDDLRYALRVYRRNRAAVILVVMGLAVAVGLTTAMFAVMNSVMFRSVAVPNQSALRWVHASGPATVSNSSGRTAWTIPEWRALDRSSGPGRTVGVHVSSADVASDAGVVARRMAVWFVGAGFFESMQTETAARGRLLVPGDQRQTVGTPVVMHHLVWTRAFGKDPGIIGRPVSLNGRPYTVVGIAPAGFDGPTLSAPAFWAPLETYDRDWRDGARLTDESLPYVTVFAELRGLHEEGLRTVLRSSVQGVTGNMDLRLERFDLEMRVKDAAPVSSAIRALLALVLSLGCANVAMLLLATQSTRRPELAARSALGASRARLIRQLMTEGILLSLIGGAFGAILSLWLSTLILSLVGAGLTTDVAVDWRVVVFIGLSSLTSGMMASLVPALRSSRVDLRSWLGQEDAQLPRSGRFSAMVIGGQTALCVTVLACTAMLTESARTAQDVEVGYDPALVLTSSLGGAVRSASIAREDARRVLETLHTLPEIASAAVARGSLVGGSTSTLTIATPVGSYRAYHQQTSEQYLRVLDVALVRGRYLSQADVEQAAPVVVIGEALAKAVWGTNDPIGHDAGKLNPTLAGYQIIGVAREDVPHDLRESGDRVSTIYRPLRAEDYPWTSAFVRVRSGAVEEVRAIQAAMITRLPERRLRFTSVAEAFDAQRQALKTPAMVAGLSAAVVLFLASVGLGGLAASYVRQRRRELAVRSALGASGSQIMWLVTGQIGKPVCLGIAAGAGLAILSGAGLKGVLVGVSPLDPTWVAIGSAILLATGGATIAGSLRAATRIPPALLLKGE